MKLPPRRTLDRHGAVLYSTFEVARLAGVTWRSLYNWLKEGRLPEPERGPNGYRLWTPEEAAAAVRLGTMAAKWQRRRKRDA